MKPTTTNVDIRVLLTLMVLFSFVVAIDVAVVVSFVLVVCLVLVRFLLSSYNFCFFPVSKIKIFLLCCTLSLSLLVLGDFVWLYYYFLL